MSREPLHPVSLALGAMLIAAAALAAKDSGRKVDLIWTHPDFAAHAPRGIAFMPAVSYNNDLPSEQKVEDAAAVQFKAVPYRWTSPRSVLTLLHLRPEADSMWKAQRALLLKSGRVDSLAAPVLCGALRVQALITFRVDQFEKRDLEWNEAGKPSTSVQVHAAMVDSTGRLLWTASGSELGEGTLQDPGNESVTGVRGSGLGNEPVTTTGKAPPYDEVLAKLFERWIERFPVPPGAAGNGAK